MPTSPKAESDIPRSRDSPAIDCLDAEGVSSLLDQAESCKNRGNGEFHKGKVFVKHTAGKNFLADACVLYAEGIQNLMEADKWLSQHHKDDDSVGDVGGKPSDQVTAIAGLRSRAEDLRPALFLNLAACNLLLEEWGPALACCSHVIDRCQDIIEDIASPRKHTSESIMPITRTIESDSITKGGDRERKRKVDMTAKALYRKSMALVGTGDLRAAREDLLLARRLKPSDIHIRRELQKVEKSIADDEAKAKLRRETEEGRERNRRKLGMPKGGTISPTREGGGDGTTRDGPCDHSLPPTQASGREEAMDNALGMAQGGEERGRVGDIESCRDGWEPARDGMEPVEGTKGRGKQADPEPLPDVNGGCCRDGLYIWNQSVPEVQVCVRVPTSARASDIRVDFRRTHLSVHLVPAGEASSTPPSETILAGSLTRPVKVDECLWTLEAPGRVHLYLQKELPSDGPPGFEWWAAVLDGDPEVDTSKCAAGARLSEYPESARRRGAKALWEHQRKSPEEREAEEAKEARLRGARQQVEEEARQRQRDLDRALRDPKKAELYRKLKETMPDVPISMS